MPHESGYRTAHREGGIMTRLAQQEYAAAMRARYQPGLLRREPNGHGGAVRKGRSLFEHHDVTFHGASYHPRYDEARRGLVTLFALVKP